MGILRSYLRSITGASLICAIAMKIPIKGASASILRMICGIFMALTLLSPISAIKINKIDPVVDVIWSEAENAASEGENIAQDAMAQLIKNRCEAYILDKAADLGVSLDVRVSLTSQQLPVPQRVVLTGAVSPYQKSVITEYLKEQLGIDGEEIQWNHP